MTKFVLFSLIEDTKMVEVFSFNIDTQSKTKIGVLSFSSKFVNSMETSGAVLSMQKMSEIEYDELVKECKYS